ncbi:hypothetical protein ACLOJK_006451 [Asimina triloba]
MIESLPQVHLLPGQFEEVNDRSVCKPLQGYMTFARNGDMKLIDNSPNPTEDFLCWCEALAHLLAATQVPSSPGTKRKQGRKKRLRKKAHSSTEGESVKEGGTFLQAATAPRMVPVIMFKAPTKPVHAGMIGPASTGPLEGFSVAIEGSSFVEPNPSPEGFSGLLLEGPPQCKAAQSKAARLQEELEASQAEVTRLQASIQEGDVRSLAVAEYFRIDVHQHREEFECSHYQSGYVRA